MSQLARCPACSRWVRLNNAGTLTRHDQHGVQIVGRTGRRRTCPGSGRLAPAGDTVAVQTGASTRARTR